MNDEMKLTLVCFSIMTLLLIFIVAVVGNKLNKLEENQRSTEKRLTAVEIHSKGVKVKPRADSYKCPVCDAYLSSSYKKTYCEKCGTPLDWGDSK